MNRYEEEDFDVLRKYLRRYERDVIFYLIMDDGF